MHLVEENNSMRFSKNPISREISKFKQPKIYTSKCCQRIQINSFLEEISVLKEPKISTSNFAKERRKYSRFVYLKMLYLNVFYVMKEFT